MINFFNELKLSLKTKTSELDDKVKLMKNDIHIEEVKKLNESIEMISNESIEIKNSICELLMEKLRMTGEIFFAIKDLRLEEIKNNIKSLKNIINLALNVIQEPKFYEESLIEIQRRKEYPKNIENSIKKITKSLKKQWNNEILKR